MQVFFFFETGTPKQPQPEGEAVKQTQTEVFLRQTYSVCQTSCTGLSKQAM